VYHPQFCQWCLIRRVSAFFCSPLRIDRFSCDITNHSTIILLYTATRGRAANIFELRSRATTWHRLLCEFDMKQSYFFPMNPEPHSRQHRWRHSNREKVSGPNFILILSLWFDGTPGHPNNTSLLDEHMSRIYSRSKSEQNDQGHESSHNPTHFGRPITFPNRTETSKTTMSVGRTYFCYRHRNIQ
jgi:hypothetical protein